MKPELSCVQLPPSASPCDRNKAPLLRPVPQTDPAVQTQQENPDTDLGTVKKGRVEMFTTYPRSHCDYYGALMTLGLAGRYGSGDVAGLFWLWREEGEEVGSRWEAGVTDEVAPPVVAMPAVAFAPGDEPR
ncbi:hypothetical protein BDK51DRAFT_35171 [Blyttiomyces helicus]|uniref:Uncharacterized protein n=1 Tax=Blyttiomyces helicus TaxID=388810 RepID=A0A4P9WTK8_9FUNG|nr:hypothetical protein BDK51DRAFT_35171 [Blyttiomyces helicus]|eukprot:RKO94406.1 hypothetical protein BDK51DRAFT_35171 [Blyttiomyces helicus]